MSPHKPARARALSKRGSTSASGTISRERSTAHTFGHGRPLPHHTIVRAPPPDTHEYQRYLRWVAAEEERAREEERREREWDRAEDGARHPLLFVRPDAADTTRLLHDERPPPAAYFVGLYRGEQVWRLDHDLLPFHRRPHPRP